MHNDNYDRSSKKDLQPLLEGSNRRTTLVVGRESPKLCSTTKKS